jgi:hypothetical protein
MKLQIIFVGNKPNRIRHLNEKGLCHKEDGPAIMWADGHWAYYENGYFQDGYIGPWTPGDSTTFVTIT